MFESRDRTIRLARPARALACGLALSLVLLAMPQPWISTARSVVAAVLQPGQAAVGSLRQRAGRLMAGAACHWNTAAQLDEARRDLDQLRQENRRLLDAVAAMQADIRRAEDPATKERLLDVECVDARVLGQQARQFLGRHYLLDAGSREQLESGDLVVETVPRLIDRGGDAGIQPSQLVLSGAAVWGMVTQVGRYTSTVRTVTEPGYRDLVQLGDARQPSRGPQGILEGTGEPLARVRLSEVTEPVAVGDAVYTAAGKGILSRPLRYGHVVRVERPAGSPHWDIWMQPAIDAAAPEHVAVLRAVLNPLRVAEMAVKNEE